MSKLRDDVTIEVLNRRGGEYLPGYLGIEMLELLENSLRSRMPVKKLHFAPNNFLHAASIVALADTTCGYGTRTLLPDEASGFTTIELKSNHLATSRQGVVTCEARAVHAGRTTQVWDAEVRNEQGQVMALFRCTQAVLYPKS